MSSIWSRIAWSRRSLKSSDVARVRVDVAPGLTRNKRFKEKTNLPAQALPKVSELLPNIEKLKKELESFINVWSNVHTTVPKHTLWLRYVIKVEWRVWTGEGDFEETEKSLDNSKEQKHCFSLQSMC